MSRLEAMYDLLEGKTDPLLASVKKVIAKSRTWFDLEEERPRSLFYSTRRNGNVGDEEPGQADIAEARRLVKLVRKAGLKVKVRAEAVDEWIHLDFSVP